MQGLVETQLALSGRTDDNLADIDFGRLLDREDDGASDCIRRDREPVARRFELGSDS